jgi:hypothetical protein
MGLNIKCEPGAPADDSMISSTCIPYHKHGEALRYLGTSGAGIEGIGGSAPLSDVFYRFRL